MTWKFEIVLIDFIKRRIASFPYINRMVNKLYRVKNNWSVTCCSGKLIKHNGILFKWA